MLALLDDPSDDIKHILRNAPSDIVTRYSVADAKYI